MKGRVILELECSETLFETMQRSGFTIQPDGSAMQVKIPNSPAVPRRKTKISFSNEDTPDFNPGEQLALAAG